MSFVPTSWKQPVLTGEFTAIGVTRVLEAIRLLDPQGHPLLPGVVLEMFGKVQEMPQKETHAVLPALSLRRRQGLRPLDHGELPRKLQDVLLLGHALQSREPAARQGVRHPQGDRRRRRGSSWAWPRSCAGQPRCPARLGLCGRLCPGHVADAAAGQAGRLRGRHGRDAYGRGAGPGGLRRTSAWTGRSTSCRTQA